MNKFFFVVLQKSWVSFRGESRARNPNIITVSSDWLEFWCFFRFFWFLPYSIHIFAPHRARSIVPPGSSTPMIGLFQIKIQSRSDPPSLSTVSSNEPKWGKNGKFLPFRAPSSETKLLNRFAPRPIDRKSSQDQFGGRFGSIQCTVLELSAENWRDPNREKFTFHPKRWWHHLFEMKSVLNGSMNPVEHEFVPREDCKIAGRFSESSDQII